MQVSKEQGGWPKPGGVPKQVSGSSVLFVIDLYTFSKENTHPFCWARGGDTQQREGGVKTGAVEAWPSEDNAYIISKTCLPYI